MLLFSAQETDLRNLTQKQKMNLPNGTVCSGKVPHVYIIILDYYVWYTVLKPFRPWISNPRKHQRNNKPFSTVWVFASLLFVSLSTFDLTFSKMQLVAHPELANAASQLGGSPLAMMKNNIKSKKKVVSPRHMHEKLKIIYGPIL